MPKMPDAGYSTCPLCGRHWLVTPHDDCSLPSCGHYGDDASAANPSRPCENCGTAHAFTCRDAGFSTNGGGPQSHTYPISRSTYERMVADLLKQLPEGVTEEEVRERIDDAARVANMVIVEDPKHDSLRHLATGKVGGYAPGCAACDLTQVEIQTVRMNRRD